MAGAGTIGCLNSVTRTSRQSRRVAAIPPTSALPAVHRVAALLKRWLLSTHQGAVSAKHLDYYLDEYTFRFNRRSARSRGLLFYRLLQQAANTAPVSFCQIVGEDHNG